MKISVIAVIGEKMEIGRQGQLLWHISEDLKNFKRLTVGHTVVMGRKTFESIGRPLPDRDNLVLSKNPELSLPGVTTYSHPSHALAHARDRGESELFVIGGANVYEQLLPLAQRMYLSHVLACEPSADAFFPKIDWDQWQREDSRSYEAGDEHPAWEFAVYARQ